MMAATGFIILASDKAYGVLPLRGQAHRPDNSSLADYYCNDLGGNT